MAHVAKYTRSAIGSLSRHYERARNQDGEYIKHKNQDIDYMKTHENYNLAPEHNQLEFIKSRCHEANCLSRDNINVMCDWIITAPKEITELENRYFFEEIYKFLCDRYDEKNVVSAYVHHDETTPHMHFSFVPVGYDKKNNRETVSAKMVLNRRDLQTFHKDLSGHMARVFGRDIGVLNEATKDGNRSIDELKRQSAEEIIKEAQEIANKNISDSKAKLKQSELEANKIISNAKEKARQKASEASKIVSGAKSEAEYLNSEIIALRAEYDAKKAYVRSCDEISDVSVMYPSYTERKKSIFGKETVTVPKEEWELKHVSANEKSYLRKATAEFEKAVAKFQNTSSAEHVRQLEQKNRALERQVIGLKQENTDLKDRVSSEEKEAQKIIKKVNKVLQELPDEVAYEFVERWKAPEIKNHFRGFDMER
jgi:hypothetical protein